MATRFYLSTSTTGAITVTGVTPAAGSTTASRVLDLVQPGAAAYTVASAASTVTDSISTTAALPSYGWQPLSGAVTLNLTTANSFIQLSAALARVNSAGAVQAQGAFTAEQSAATTGAKTFAPAAPASWGTASSTDRLALVVRVRNTDTGSSRSVTFTVGASHYLDAPVEQGWTPVSGAGLGLTAGSVGVAIGIPVTGQGLTVHRGGWQLVTVVAGVGTVAIPPTLLPPLDTLDPRTYPFPVTADDPAQALTWFTQSTTPDTSTTAATTSRVVQVEGQTLASATGTSTIPGLPQFAALATWVPYWVRQQAAWAPRARRQFTPLLGVPNTSVTINPTGFTLTLSAGSALNFGAQAAGSQLQTVPWWERIVWRARQRFQLQRAVELTYQASSDVTVAVGGQGVSAAAGTLTTVQTAGWRDAAIGLRTLPWVQYRPWRPQQRFQAAGLFVLPQTPGEVRPGSSGLLAAVGAAAVYLTSTALPAGASVSSAVGTVTASGGALEAAVGSSATLTLGSVTVTTLQVRTVLATGQVLQTTAGSVASTQPRVVYVGGQQLAVLLGAPRSNRVVDVPVTGRSFAIQQGTVSVQTLKQVGATGRQLGSAVGVALARFPVQAPQAVGLTLTAASASPLAVPSVPLEVGVQSLYGPFDADQVFGVGST